MSKVSFTVDKNGKPLAYRVSYKQMRNFRISWDKAKLMIATGEAEEVAYHPFGRYDDTLNPVAWNVGDRVKCNGYEGAVGRVCEGQLAGMVEVRLNSGTVCVDGTDPRNLERL